MFNWIKFLQSFLNQIFSRTFPKNEIRRKRVSQNVLSFSDVLRMLVPSKINNQRLFFKQIIFSVFFLSFSFISFGQIVPATSDTLREFEILKAPSMRSMKIDSVTTLQTLAGGVIVRQGTVLFNADSAVINPNTHIIEAFGNIHINQDDSLNTYGQYLKYLGVERMAYLKKDVRLTDGKGTLLTQDLDYNLGSGIGNFYNGGKVTENKTVITSTEGTYYADTKDVYFKKNVKLDGPKDHVRADSLLYNMSTKKSSFISKTNIKNADIEINTNEGTYDLNTGDAFFTKRTTVKDSSGRIYTADNMALENKSGNAQLEGNAVVIDTSNNFVVIANQIFLNKKNNSFLATRKPVVILIRDNDSTYIAGDTVFSGITTRVEMEKMRLQKDSVVNLNLEENARVNTIIHSDTARKYLPEDSIIKGDDSMFLKVPKHSLISKDSLIPIPKLPDSSGIQDVRSVINKESEDTSLLMNKKKIILKDSSVVISKDSSQNLTSDTSLLMKKKKIILKDSSLINSKDSSQKISSDTSRNKMDSSGKVKDSTNLQDSTIRYFLAFHNVKIYNDSLQSVCDSMFYSTKDSTFRLYYDPVVWSGQSQLSGDTMFLFTQNNKPKRLYAFEKTMAVNKTVEGFFNQMSGKTLNGYFEDGKIDYVRMKGSQAESVHYLQDADSAYFGMNRATGDVIDLYFKKDQLIRVIFVHDVNGKMYPMTKIPKDQKELKDFKWLDNRRPKNKLELFQ